MSEADDRKPPAAKRARKERSSATDGADEGDSAAEEAREPQPCMPCHGTGKVISKLDEQTRRITCPWCRGGGVRLTGVDAQEWQLEQAALKRR
jgi:DnaJ-class molecular chaperone